jgi:hypothetical protein
MSLTRAGIVMTIAGSGSPGNVNGIGTSAQFGTMLHIALSNDGKLFVADMSFSNIRSVDTTGASSSNSLLHLCL